jgi:hypothetical protein
MLKMRARLLSMSSMFERLWDLNDKGLNEDGLPSTFVE